LLLHPGVHGLAVAFGGKVFPVEIGANAVHYLVVPLVMLKDATGKDEFVFRGRVEEVHLVLFN